MAAKKTKQTASAPDVLELDYQLAELSSSQHRSGLAGLVLMVDWLKRQPDKQGVCEITRLDARGATLKINQQGLEDLFNEVYGAFNLEPEATAEKKEQPNPSATEVEDDDDDEKDSKARVVPKGAFLPDLDQSLQGDWIKLWRDMLFGTLRGRHRQRIPFKQNAEDQPITEAAKSWEALAVNPAKPVKMPSTFFAGAQDNNAEDVPFKDHARFQFLLNFWPYVAQTYVPTIIDSEGKPKHFGFALAIPDISNLLWFCEELPSILKHKRSVARSGYRPRDSVIDLPIEGALDVATRLRERLTVKEGERATSDLVLGIDVIHFVKEKRNVNIKSISRLVPEAVMIDRYAQFRHSLWNPLFRRQRLLNLVNQRNWHAGFDSLLGKLPYEQTIGNSYFRRDARESFNHEGKTMNETQTTSTEEVEVDDLSSASLNDEELIFRVVGKYLRQKLDGKYKLSWKQVQGNPAKEKEYREMKAKLARDAFLAIRSRTGQDFVDYFVATLCSVSQSMNEQRFVALTKALVSNTEQVRTLTMLALAAQTPNPQQAAAQ
jgi:CRISPR-associated protein Cmx8